MFAITVAMVTPGLGPASTFPPSPQDFDDLDCRDRGLRDAIELAGRVMPHHGDRSLECPSVRGNEDPV